VSQYLNNSKSVVFHGNCLEELKNLPDNSIDSIVTDPPYGLGDSNPDYIVDALKMWVSGDRSHIPAGKGFMGKSWDAFVPPPAVWDECFRVLKPGGHILVFAGARTQDLMCLSVRMAGFEIRDSISWIYGSGFPKSLDISKALDKMAGAEREVLGRNPNSRENATKKNTLYESGTVGKTDFITAPSTDAAKQWDGWGTALKPALEPIIVGRKPLSEKNVSLNVLRWGTGGINIDKSRIVTDTMGRFPANLIFTHGEDCKVSTPLYECVDGCPVKELDGQSDGVSRFFYVAKANKKDRNEGLDETANVHPTVKPTSLMAYLVKLVTPAGGTVLDPFTGSGSTGKAAILSGFHFVGVEMTDEYLPIIRGRIEHAVSVVEAEKKKDEETLF
jgi:site-specific DNA-methyltransferase (adenine-specific)